jgi:hypothetical protein
MLMTKKNTVTQEHVENIFQNTTLDYATTFGKCTVLTAQLPNGFIIVESSACVDPINFDADMGADICNERVKNKIWELEGYVLQSKLEEANRPVRPEEVGFNGIVPKTWNMSFGQAIEALKAGLKVKRAAWGGYWFIEDVAFNGGEEQEDVYGANYGVVMILAKLKDNAGYAPAQPYQADILANDWEVIE